MARRCTGAATDAANGKLAAIGRFMNGPPGIPNVKTMVRAIRRKDKGRM